MTAAVSVEVMGRNAGYLALNTGIAVGALATLIPEIPYDIDRDIVQRMNDTRKDRQAALYHHCG